MEQLTDLECAYGRLTPLRGITATAVFLFLLRVMFNVMAPIIGSGTPTSSSNNNSVYRTGHSAPRMTLSDAALSVTYYLQRSRRNIGALCFRLVPYIPPCIQAILIHRRMISVV